MTDHKAGYENIHDKVSTKYNYKKKRKKLHENKKGRYGVKKGNASQQQRQTAWKMSLVKFQKLNHKRSAELPLF